MWDFSQAFTNNSERRVRGGADGQSETETDRCTHAARVKHSKTAEM